MKRKLLITVMLLTGIYAAVNAQEPRFKISLAEWSLHQALMKKELTNLDFPRITKTKYNLDGVEYVSTFFAGKGGDSTYLAQLKDSCTRYGITSVLIMVDGEGNLADTSAQRRLKAVENHYKWVKAAKFLGCHSIRVNAAGRGTKEQMMAAAIDGLSRLSDYAAKYDINVIVENHGGYSSIGTWLTAVIKGVNRRNCGVLPDLGNFYEYDRYQGVTDMMPYAKGVSGKTHDFDANGNETQIDYKKMFQIISASCYRGYVDVEYEGLKLNEDEGIKASIALVKKVIEPYNK
ncbi:MAG: sugar phosphate isomerase/epimerase family protein [Bacteroidales bacterium]